MVVKCLKKKYIDGKKFNEKHYHDDVVTDIVHFKS